MAREARYTEQASVKVEPDMKAEIRRIADRYGVSDGDVIRECIDAALSDVETELSRRSAQVASGSSGTA